MCTYIQTHTHLEQGASQTIAVWASLLWRDFSVCFIFLRFDPVNSYLRVGNLTLDFVKIRTERQQVTSPFSSSETRTPLFIHSWEIKS